MAREVQCEHGRLFTEFCWDCIDRSAAMTTDEPQQAMTSERLAQIEARVGAAIRTGADAFCDVRDATSIYASHVSELLIDNERLRAALAQEQQVSMARAAALASLRDAYEELAAEGDFDQASDEIRQRVHDVLYHAKPEASSDDH